MVQAREMRKNFFGFFFGFSKKKFRDHQFEAILGGGPYALALFFPLQILLFFRQNNIILYLLIEL